MVKYKSTMEGNTFYHFNFQCAKAQYQYCTVKSTNATKSTKVQVHGGKRIILVQVIKGEIAKAYSPGFSLSFFS